MQTETIHVEQGREEYTADPSEILHEIHFEDVSISVQAITMLYRAARNLLTRHLPGSDPDALTKSTAVAMFVDQVFWNERTGELVMCSAIENLRFCVPIPGSHWDVCHTGKVH